MNTKSPIYPIFNYVEGLENENASLKGKLSDVQNELSDDEKKLLALQDEIKAAETSATNAQETITNLQSQLTDLDPGHWKWAALRVISAGIWAQQLRIPYVFGGIFNPAANPMTEKDKGFDCSSFVQSLYKLIGIDLPRLATPQSLTGTPIDYDKMDEGDLIFFDVFKTKAQIQTELAKDSNCKVDHVGIYLGGGKMLHTNTPKQGIHVSAISDWYEPHFVRARRVIKH